MSSQLIYAFACVFFAAVVRGFSGFGFALLVIVSVSLVLPPDTIVPAMIVLEVVAGLHLLPSIWKDIHWRSIGVMVGAAIVCTPLGVYTLAHVPAEPMKLGVSLVVILATALLMRRAQLSRMPTGMETAATGAAAGILNGAVGLAGPPIIIFFLGSPLALEAGRASIIAAFLAIDVASLVALFSSGMLSAESVQLAVLLLPALAAGVFAGSRLVGRVDQATARKSLLVILLIMSVASAGRSIFLLMRS